MDENEESIQDGIVCRDCGRGLYGMIVEGKLETVPCGYCARTKNPCRYCVEHGRTCCPHLGCTCAPRSSQTCPYCGAPRIEVEGEEEVGHVEFLCHTWWDDYSSTWIDPVCKYIRSLRFELEHPGLHILEDPVDLRERDDE